MAGKTAGVRDLAHEVLAIMPTPYGEDVIEDVFVAVEDSTWMRPLYDQLVAELGKDTVNPWLARYVREATGMEKLRDVKATRTELITSYAKLTHQR